MLIQKGAVRKPHLPGLETAKLTPMGRAKRNPTWTLIFNRAVTKVREELPADPEVEYLLQFIETSKRSIGFSHPNRPVKGNV